MDEILQEVGEYDPGRSRILVVRVVEPFLKDEWVFRCKTAYDNGSTNMSWSSDEDMFRVVELDDGVHAVRVWRTTGWVYIGEVETIDPSIAAATGWRLIHEGMGLTKGLREAITRKAGV